MHRVLSFQMARGFGESAEFVTKRMCFSFIFFIGFLALLGGFLLGRFTTERNMKIREDRKLLQFAGNGLESTGDLQFLLLEELQKTSFNKFRPTQLIHPTLRTDANQDDTGNHEDIRTTLSNLNLFHTVVQGVSGVVATLRGSRESDRWIMLSVSGDGIRPAIELAKVIAKLRRELNWMPRRTIIFCFFHEFEDTCRSSIPKYLRSRVMAYLAVHGTALQENGCLAASGSDVVKSVVLQAVATVRDSISKRNFDKQGVFESCKSSEDLVLLPRLLTDIPHTSLAFLTVSNSTSSEPSSDQQMQAHNRILAQIIGLSIWRLSDSVVLHWDPKDLKQELKAALKKITFPELNDIKERIFWTIEKLIVSMHNLTETTNKEGEGPSTLFGRMKNDQLIDLDRTLLCQNNELRSKTDLALIPTILNESLNKIAIFLGEMFQCYDNAAKILQQG